MPKFRILRSSAALLAVALFASCHDDPPRAVSVENLDSKPVAPIAPIEPPKPAEPVEERAVVVNVVGKVEIRRGEGPSWDEARIGDKIDANDALRTGDAANVELTIGDARLRVRERSDVKVKKVGRGGMRARVNGHMEADVKEGSGAQVDLEADGSDTVLTTRGGSVAMVADGSGVVSVAAKSGAASLLVKGKDISLSAGEVTRVIDDKVEREAMRELLFAVKWPGQTETNKAVLPLEGSAPPGSRVLVAGNWVRVDKKGRFRTKVPLRSGRQKIAVVVTDVLGRTKESSKEILLDKNNTLELEKPKWGH